MKAVLLVPIDEEVEEALAGGPGEFRRRFGADAAEAFDTAREVVRETLQFMTAVPRGAPWGGYLALDRASARVVGPCGFKFGPTPDGTVEIAYYTFRPFEGRGYATAMAAALLEIATRESGIRRVIAHTLPVADASTRVLEKIGMRRAGELNDPEDGLVWQWELPGPAVVNPLPRE